MSSDVKLELSIYNKQTKTSASGKDYIARVCVFTPGQSGRLTEADQIGPFYIRDQKGATQWVRLSAKDITEAKSEALKFQIARDANASGVTASVPGAADGDRLTNQIAKYLSEIESNKARTTWLAYTRALDLFTSSCSRLNVQAVTREDMLAFKTYLRKQGSLGERAAYNHFLNVSVFFKWAKHPLIGMGIKKADWPAKPEREPEAYTKEEIDALLTAAAKTFRGMPRRKDESRDDRLLFNALLCSGLRDGELAHLSYADIDSRHSLWTVRPKNGHNLKTAHSQRVVPVPDWLTKRVLDQQKTLRVANNDFIFATDAGKADLHLLRILNRVGEEAGLGGRFDLHKFRSTAITTWLRNGMTVPDVMAFVGHTNPTTILRYAAKIKLEDRTMRARVTAPFAQFEGVGD